MQPADLQKLFQSRIQTPSEAMERVRSGDRIYLGSNCGQPLVLTAALEHAADRLHGVEIVHLVTFGPAPYVEPQFSENFKHVAFFIGPNTRDASRAGRVEYMPVFLSDVPGLFRTNALPIDVALVSVTPPDEHGFCSLGISVDLAVSACRYAKTVIAEVNPHMPRTLGDSFLHVSQVDAFVLSDIPLIEHPSAPTDAVSDAIGGHVARLIDDGACLQTGIGKIPGAVLANLTDKNDLGLHTEMFSDAVIEAIQRGNITCRRKNLHRNKAVASFCIASRSTYDAIDNNPFFHFAPTEYVNDPFVIGQNDGMVAINGAIQVDLTGQVVSDSLGSEIYSGIGGQVDFIRGAARSNGGKPIITLPSTAKSGRVSRIVVTLTEGAGVVTSRGDVHYVVTEYGVAYLHGRSTRERALELIRIAHPDFRDQLLEQAKDRGIVPREQPAVEAIYPVEYERALTLRDGREVFLRPIKSTDDQLLKRHFYGLSPVAVQRRFNRMVRTLTNGAISDLVNVDYRLHMAVVVVRREGEAETLLATGRYYVNPATNSAELAFAVLDEWQNLGMGRVLLDSLLTRAREHRLSSLVAYVSPDNAGMLHILMNCGVEADSRREDDMQVVTLRLRPQRS
jgi:acyl-CoA hydrolase/GNAT superfamily N-acetyltransferase